MARGTQTPQNGNERRLEFDPNFNGPSKKRSCTDIICFFLFIVMIGCSLGVGIFAYVNGDPELLLTPKDSRGSRCGVDAHVADKPYLFFFDLTKCLNPNTPFTGCDTPQVCVAKCPDKVFVFDAVNKNVSPDMRIDDLICENGLRPRDFAEANAMVAQGKCARWFLPSTEVVKRCLPSLKRENIDAINRHLQDQKLSMESLTSATKNIKAIENTKQIGHDVVEDLKASWPEIVGGLATAIVVCIIYIAVMRWITPIMVWISILGSLAVISFCLYVCIKQYTYYKAHPYEHEEARNVFEKYTNTKDFWLTITIIVAIFLVILLLMLIFLRKRIVLAIALIKESSKAVGDVTSTLFFPVVPWILQMAVIIYALSVALYLGTVGKPLYEIRKFPENLGCTGPISHYKDGVRCDLQTFAGLIQKYCVPSLSIADATCKFVGVDNPAIVPYLHAFNIFCFFWGVFFISALGEMILASTFATWYWTFNKGDVPYFTLTAATGRTLRYHVGTLAFGSLIIAICRMIRFLLEYIDAKLKKFENPFTKAILCCMKCFFWCLENFLKFISKNAYIMCAIHGKNFCSSAKDAFSLLVSNMVRVFVLDKITDFLFFLSKIFVSIGVASIIYSFLEFVSKKELNYVFVPVTFVAICTYFVASVFFSVYTMAVDTLFLCFLEDCERNDGSSEKPYFMSKNLMKILGKGNKTS